MTELLIVNGPLSEPASSILAISVGHARVAPPSLRVPSPVLCMNAIPPEVLRVLQTEAGEQ